MAVRGFALGAAIMAADGIAAGATTTASATVIAPIAISKSADLSFGKFAPGTGGSLSVGAAQVPGVYSGNITVTVEYN